MQAYYLKEHRMSTRTNEAKWIERRKMWRIDVQKDGTRKSFYSSIPGRKGKIECHNKADEWLEHDVYNADTRVQVLMDKWIEHQKMTTSRSAWIQYEGYVRRYFTPAFGFKRIRKLTEQDIQDLIDMLASQGLARKTLQNVRAAFSSFLKWARKHNYTVLRCEEITIPVIAQKGERHILQVDDFAKVMQCTETTYYGKIVEDWYIHAYRLALCIGLRPGELLGLRWSNVSFAEKRLTVTESINVYNEHTAGKNENARRTIPLGETALSILSAQRQQLMRASMVSEYVFPDRHGGHTVEKNLRMAWYRFQEHNGIQPKTLYEIRHTFVSANKNLPEGMVRSVVGHSKDMDTFGVYGHVFGDDESQTAAHIDANVAKILAFKKQ